MQSFVGRGLGEYQKALLLGLVAFTSVEPLLHSNRLLPHNEMELLSLILGAVLHLIIGIVLHLI